jgi:ubiquilin
VVDLKKAIAEKSDVEAERQRLIYSGALLLISFRRVLIASRTRIEGMDQLRALRHHLCSPMQDEDALSVYKIQSSHTIHMVKGVSRSGASGGTSSAAPVAPQQFPAMQTGQNPSDPLTQLNGHQGFGAMAGLNPFGDMGLNPNDPNMVRSCSLSSFVLPLL